MMHDLNKMYVKPGDYKVCWECEALNWYENVDCIACGCTDFKNDERTVKLAVMREIEFREELKFTSTEIEV